MVGGSETEKNLHRTFREISHKYQDENQTCFKIENEKVGIEKEREEKRREKKRRRDGKRGEEMSTSQKNMLDYVCER